MLEWLYQTLDKRVGPPYFCKLKDLFLVVPYLEEAEFAYELESWNYKEGNDLARDYPNLYKILGHNRKDSSIKVFFVHPLRCSKNLILHVRKYAYPKVSRTRKLKSSIEFNNNQKVLRFNVN